MSPSQVVLDTRSRIADKPLEAFLWLGVAVVAIGYAPLAFEAIFPFFDGRIPQFTVRLGDQFLPREFLHGPQSGVVHEQATYPQTRWWLLVHTTTAGVMLTIGIFQFSKRLRSARPRLHRNLGKTYMLLSVVSMTGAIGYLVKTPAQQVFSGVPFAWALWAIAAGVLFTTGWSYRAIRGRDFRSHQRLQYINYAFLMTAPLLRIEWAILHFVVPHASHAAVNLLGTLSLAPLVLIGAIVAARLSERSLPSLERQNILPSKSVANALRVGGAIGVVWLVTGYVHASGRIDMFLLGLAIPWGVMSLGVALSARASMRRGRVAAAQEWRVHLLALNAAPIVVAIVWLFARQTYAPIESFLAAGTVGWPIAMAGGYFYVVRARSKPRKVAAEHHEFRLPDAAAA